MDIYQGDPKMINGPNGTRFNYAGGQPIMDQGIENSINIDLFTKSKGLNSHQKGWIGNYLLPLSQRIGSDYQDTVEKQPGTLAGLANIEKAAKRALSGDLYGDVESTASNPEADTMVNDIKVGPPAGITKFQTTFSQLWQAQATKTPDDKPPAVPGRTLTFARLLGKDTAGDYFNISGLPGGETLTGKVEI